MKKILDLGCGSHKQQNAFGVDSINFYGVDLVHDLNKTPYPLKSDDWDVIYLDNVLEHLDNTFLILEEVHRLLKPGGECRIYVPYFRSHWSFMDPTHIRHFSAKSLLYLDKDSHISNRYSYTSYRFTTKTIAFDMRQRGSMLWRLIRFVANRKPNFYEAKLSHLFPLNELYFCLQK